MKKIIIASLSLLLICAYAGNAQSKASKSKSSVHKKKKGAKFLPPEIRRDEVMGMYEPPMQNSISTEEHHTIIVREGEPNYPLGSDTFYSLLSRRVKMPEAATQKGIQGNVKLSFVVGLQGNLSDFEIQNSLGSGCDEEAIRVIKSLGNWSPAQKDGQAIISTVVFSVAFGVAQRRELSTPIGEKEQAQPFSLPYSVEENEKKHDLPPPVAPTMGLQEKELTAPVAPPMRLQEDEIYTAVEEPAGFPGGVAEYVKYIEKNLIYPEDAKTKKLEGNVYVQFMVSTDGSSSNFDILKSVGSGIDEEAIRVLKSVPRWKPGNQSGKAVPSRITIPVKFKLPE
jgi:TonB family protein